MNLIIGLGNILLTDEGIGIHVLKELEKRNNILNAEFLDLGTSSLDLEYFIKNDTKKIAVIDCIKTTGCNYGEIFKLSCDDLKKKRNSGYSLHQLEFIDSINLILLLSELPPILIFGIIPYDTKSPSLNLSEPLKEKFSVITEKIENEINIFFNQ